MIVDEVLIHVRAGNGAPGHVSYRREKFVPHGGPDGGNGGTGGDVYFVGVSDLSALSQFRANKNIKGVDGGNGKSKKRHGKGGEDLLVRIPIGTKITDMISKREIEITKVGHKLFVAKGGTGGKGNWELRSAQNKTPHAAEPGVPGQERTFLLNLQYIADIGLIGLPNAGKSSLLNILTNASVKTADYPFTTLEPNLGEMEGKIIADIPGLIEGASSGKGLGIKFLKHIEKTRLLVHCIDASSSSQLTDYKTIREELKKYNPLLLQKREIVALTKNDLVSEKELKAEKKRFEKMNDTVFVISILDDSSIQDLKKYLLQI